MVRPSNRADRDAIALRKHLDRWLSIVELYARRRPGRRRVEPAAYAALHRALLAACRAPGTWEPARREALDRLVAPWLSTVTLARADRELLADLLARLRALQRELGGRRHPAGALVRGARGALTAAGATALAAALVAASGLGPETVAGLPSEAGRMIRLASRAAGVGAVERWGALAAAAIAASVFLASRATKH